MSRAGGLGILRAGAPAPPGGQKSASVLTLMIMLNLKFEDDKIPPRMPNGGSGTAVFEGNREGYGKLEGVRIKEFHL